MVWIGADVPIGVSVSANWIAPVVASAVVADTSIVSVGAGCGNAVSVGGCVAELNSFRAYLIAATPPADSPTISTATSTVFRGILLGCLIVIAPFCAYEQKFRPAVVSISWAVARS